MRALSRLSYEGILDLEGTLSSRSVADVHQQIARQTRWILTVLGGAVVLFPIIQRLMECCYRTDGSTSGRGMRP